MARTRTLLQLRNEVRQRADVESATKRFPDAEVTRYVNQGVAELYDILVDARGASYYRKATPQSITTTADTVAYALASDFYKLISVRVSNGPPLETFDPLKEAEVALTEYTAEWPLYYDVQGANIALRPYHDAGYIVLVEYIPTATELSADGDTFDGINGWEEYVVAFGAKCCAEKDGAAERIDRCAADMARLRQRIAGLAPSRDKFRPERIRDARGTRAHLRGGWR